LEIPGQGWPTPKNLKKPKKQSYFVPFYFKNCKMYPKYQKNLLGFCTKFGPQEINLDHGLATPSTVGVSLYLKIIIVLKLLIQYWSPHWLMQNGKKVNWCEALLFYYGKKMRKILRKFPSFLEQQKAVEISHTIDQNTPYLTKNPIDNISHNFPQNLRAVYFNFPNWHPRQNSRHKPSPWDCFRSLNFMCVAIWLWPIKASNIMRMCDV
jgi:hypothetical protein